MPKSFGISGINFFSPNGRRLALQGNPIKAKISGLKFLALKKVANFFKKTLPEIFEICSSFKELWYI